MKLFIVLVMLSTCAFAKENKVKKEVPQNIKPEARQFLEDAAEEEDCEEKAKKPVIIPEEPVLGLGNAGCSLEDM